MSICQSTVLFCDGVNFKPIIMSFNSHNVKDTEVNAFIHNLMLAERIEIMTAPKYTAKLIFSRPQPNRTTVRSVSLIQFPMFFKFRSSILLVSKTDCKQDFKKNLYSKN